MNTYWDWNNIQDKHFISLWLKGNFGKASSQIQDDQWYNPKVHSFAGHLTITMYYSTKNLGEIIDNY